MKVPRLRVVLGLIASLNLVPAVIIVLVLPRVFDSATSQRRIRADFAERVAVKLNLGTAQLAWFPRRDLFSNR